MISFALGVLASFLVWAIVTHGLKPRFRFSPKIAKFPSPETGDEQRAAYRVKFENAGWRSAVDVEIQVLAKIKRLTSESPTTTIFSMPLMHDGRTHYRIPILESSRRGGRRRLVWLLPDRKLDYFLKDQRFEALHGQARVGQVELEEILALGSDAWLEIYLFAYDSFSGTRRVFAAPQYRRDDVVEGRFVKGSLDIAPAS